MYASPDDLRTMQALVQEAWRLGGPKNERHVGDLAWSAFQHAGREREWARRLWFDGGELVAYGWLYLPEATLDWQLHPQLPQRSGLLDAVLDWFEAEAEGDLATSALAEDAAALETLRSRGYAVVEGRPWTAYLARDLSRIAEPAVPAGFTLRTVGPEDVVSRVDAHRSAFEPSRVTVASYRNVMAAWPYRPELDCVAVAPDDRVASYVLVWYDDANRVGELEPVGTHREFRRLGLARAVSLDALRRLRDAGAEQAIVLCRGDDGYPAPKRLYESVGFRQHSRSVGFRKRA
jgi:ribosomal protein S18 acetylase RimI-like enzyme